MPEVSMHGVSRESLRVARERLEQYADGADSGALATLADELFAVGRLLDSRASIRRLLADSSAEPSRRQALAERLIGGQVGEQAQQLIRELAGTGWSAPGDLADVVDSLGCEALLAAAAAADRLDEVEDELFRFGRIVTREPQLHASLSDPAVSVERRVGLLDTLVSGKVADETRDLLHHALVAPRGLTFERRLAGISELAAVRRGRFVAYVRSATELTDEQQQRLAAALQRIYRREVDIRLDVDPAVIGGLSIKVGDEVIDGSMQHRLDQLRRTFAE